MPGPPQLAESLATSMQLEPRQAPIPPSPREHFAWFSAELQVGMTQMSPTQVPPAPQAWPPVAPPPVDPVPVAPPVFPPVPELPLPLVGAAPVAVPELLVAELHSQAPKLWPSAWQVWPPGQPAAPTQATD
jgi:hypothetical protein